MRFHTSWLLASASLALLGVLAVGANSDIEKDILGAPVAEVGAVRPDKIDKGLTKMIDFSQFQAKFGKKYKSIIEQARRGSIYITNALRAIISKINFSRKRATSFMEVNNMSDWTSEEYESTLINPDIYEALTAAKSDANEKVEFVYADPNSCATRLGGHLDVEHDHTIPKTTVSTTAKPKSYTLLELVSGEALADQLDMGLMNAHGWWYTKRQRSDLPDEVFVDHSKQGCLGAVRSQGHCGSCYIFAALALYEWAHCQATGERLEFSEQYLLDCGHHEGLCACGGGLGTQVERFVQKFGFEPRSHYPYKQRRSVCPYDAADVDDKAKGMKHLRQYKLATVRFFDYESQLERSPITISMRTNLDFRQYKGGVDEAKGCLDKQSLHAMLLVGHGRENGQEYWILRNSHGDYWGENGYYRMLKSAPCIDPSIDGLTLAAMLKRPGLLKSLASKVMGSGDQQAPVGPIEFANNPDHKLDVVMKTITDELTGPMPVPKRCMRG